jgi:predicted amino acid-binding ACT domain protein
MGGINIKGISDTIMKTEGTITLKLFTDTHETTQTFHVVETNLESNTMAF